MAASELAPDEPRLVGCLKYLAASVVSGASAPESVIGSSYCGIVCGYAASGMAMIDDDWLGGAGDYGGSEVCT